MREINSYDELVESIKDKSKCSIFAHVNWSSKYLGEPIYNESEVVIKIARLAYMLGKAEVKQSVFGRELSDAYNEEYERGFNDAAKDPKAWYVLDKNGEQVHIGDAISLSNGAVKKIKALGYGGGCSTNTTWIDLSKCEKVKTDTREKIIEDLAACFVPKEDGESPKQLADWFVSRIEALGGTDE